MAERPVFIANMGVPFVRTEKVEFRFFSGFAVEQARKSIHSLHDSFIQRHPEYAGAVLEVSTKSEVRLGTRLSAFNLLYTLSDGRRRTVESVFQAGKCFANGKQYIELLDMSSMEAKRFEPLRSSGEITGFRLDDVAFPTQPITFFYDWLYVNALYQNQDLATEVEQYRAFTDIAFNPARSWNCQARSVALYVALHESGKLQDAISSPERFLEVAFADCFDRTGLTIN